MILRCNCNHEYQDHVYGKQLRVHNPKKRDKGGNAPQEWRCTVCGAVRTESERAK